MINQNIHHVCIQMEIVGNLTEKKNFFSWNLNKLDFIVSNFQHYTFRY